MIKIIYVDQPFSITPEINASENLVWEIDNDDHLLTNPTPDGIIITPQEQALTRPDRILKYTIEETGISEEFELTIKKAEIKKEPEASAVPDGQETQTPETLKVSPRENILIPGTRDMLNDVLWFFSNEKFNAHLSLEADGVRINRLPPGMYTLYYQFPGREQKEIIIQSAGDQQAKIQKANTIRTSPDPVEQPLQSPEVSDEYKNDARAFTGQVPQPEDKEKGWPKTVEKCAVVVSLGGQNMAKFPIETSSSLLIGKKSRSHQVVDVDMEKYTINTRDISRNHLKIWHNDEYLMMKNIGSHRVYYSDKEVFPDQMAVLKIGGEVKLGDTILTITRA